EKNLSSMRLSNLILADFNALLRRTQVPSCLPPLLETHTEYGFLSVSLSTSPTLPLCHTPLHSPGSWRQTLSMAFSLCPSPPLPPSPSPPPSPWALWLTHTEFGFSL